MATIAQAIVGDAAAGAEISPALLLCCQRALGHYVALDGGGGLGSATIAPLGDGLINETFLVTPSALQPASEALRPLVLQRVNPLFGRAVHDDIEAVTAHLEARGLATPRLVKTAAGELSVDLGSDGVWRVLTFISGRTYSVMVPALAAPSGELVGRFHAALVDLHHRFHFVRPGAHDLGGHLEKLRQALRAAAQPDFVPREAPVPAELLGLGRELLAHGETLPLTLDPRLPLRLCHGDLKLSNLRFAEDGRGRCLLDLDTLAELPLGFELGDALRSWCNPAGEDCVESRFDLGLFESALGGYARTARFLLPSEPPSIVPGIERVAFQLAVRFATDGILQSYFRWNRQRYPSRAAHNWVRAAGQWSLCRSLIAARSEAQAIVARVFAAPSPTS